MINRLLFITIALLFLYSDAFARRTKEAVLAFSLLRYEVDGDSLKQVQGSERDISIPLVITDHHRGLLYWLREQGLKDIVLVNLDPHRDYYREPRNRIIDNGAQSINIVHSGNWIDFAYTEGIVSDIYWCLPRWFEVRLEPEELGTFILEFGQIDWARHREKDVVISIDLDSFSHRPVPQHRIPLDRVDAYLGDMAQNLIDNAIRPIFHISESPNFTYQEDVESLIEAVLRAFSFVYGSSGK